jgi:hypothetical protein
MKRQRHPTPEEFKKLLDWLDANPDEAGRTFNLIHSRLIRIFAARGCIDAESLAEEVSNRVAVRIDQVVKNYSDPLRCCLGFVENVYREDLRDQQKRLTAQELLLPRPAEELEMEDECLEQCLRNLTQVDRDLFERYFQGEKRARINRRKKLAAELEITANALRIRAFHLRKEMHQCIIMCLDKN